MKRLLLLASFFLAEFIAMSQDLITRKDGTEIQAKILEVNTSEIKYKRYSNPDGPVFTLPISDILEVRYENGENDVFTDNQSTVFPGMRYHEYKDLYDSHDYVRQPGDPYSPFWIGFADFFIPGLGNAIAGEWGRAAGFCLVNLGLGLIGNTQRTATVQNGYTYYEYNTMYWVIMAARVGLNIWSVCDAVHVAKVKNMYNQDLRARRVSLDYGLEPFFAYAPSRTTLQPVAGLSLVVSF